MRLILQSASPLSPQALIRYLLLSAATKKSDGVSEDPDGEILE